MEEKRIDIRFLEFLEPHDGNIKSDVKIAPFMIENFQKPDPLDLNTKPETDEGVRFLQTMSDRKLIRVHMDTIRQVNYWKYPKGDKEYKHWFDTQAHTVEITRDGLDYLYQYRNNMILLETSISTTKTNNAVRNNIIAQIILGIVATVSIVLTCWYAIATYYKDDPESLKLIHKELQHQDSILESILQSQKGIDTSLKTMAKKTSLKNH